MIDLDKLEQYRENNRIEAKKALGDGVVAYTDFDAFIRHEGLEAVFLCNNFQQHAPFAFDMQMTDAYGIHTITPQTAAEAAVASRSSARIGFTLY